MTKYPYSPDTGELIRTDSPSDWMGLAEVDPPIFDPATAGCFWRGDHWEVVPAKSTWTSAPILEQIRAAREVVLNRLAGIGFAALASNDSATASAVVSARSSLLNITAAPGVASATDDQSLKVALYTAYSAIVQAAPDNLKNAFAEFNL